MTASVVSTGLPQHDLAHYVVERQLGIQRGFYGNIVAGFSLDELGDTNIIKTLPAESMRVESLARALQLVAGGQDVSQFLWLAGDDAAYFSNVTQDRIKSMVEEYQELLARWAKLGEGETLELVFPATFDQPSEENR